MNFSIKNVGFQHRSEDFIEFYKFILKVDWYEVRQKVPKLIKLIIQVQVQMIFLPIANRTFIRFQVTVFQLKLEAKFFVLHLAQVPNIIALSNLQTSVIFSISEIFNHYTLNDVGCNLLKLKSRNLFFDSKLLQTQYVFVYEK